MAQNYFKVVVKMDRTLENGLVKNVSETYLVDAMSHAEAEARVVEEAILYASGELVVHSIMRCGLADVITSEDGNADKYYQTTIGLITLDEKSGKEKQTKQRILIQACDFDDAVGKAKEEMKNWYGEVVTLELKQTNFVEYLRSIHNS